LGFLDLKRAYVNPPRFLLFLIADPIGTMTIDPVLLKLLLGPKNNHFMHADRILTRPMSFCEMCEHRRNVPVPLIAMVRIPRAQAADFMLLPKVGEQLVRPQEPLRAELALRVRRERRFRVGVTLLLVGPEVLDVVASLLEEETIVARRADHA
jgi:hypothetical protein